MLLSDIPTLAAHHSPTTPAIIFQDETISYARMRDRCWRLSNALIPVTEAGDRVAILAENCPEYVDCYYGVPGAGLALTLLNYRLAPPELAYIIGNAEPRILILEAKYLPAIRQILHGDALAILHRKVSANVGSLTETWYTPVVPLVAITSASPSSMPRARPSPGPSAAWI